MSYCTPNEVRAMAQGMSTSATPPASDELVRALIERVSRFFDLEVGCDPGYFDPALYPVWQSVHAYVVGDIITPTTPNAHKYRCTTAGTSGSTEPAWSTVSNATFTDGTAVFTENGADVVATARTFYPDGTNYLQLDPYVAGSLTTVTMPTGYTVPDYVERDGRLIRTGTDHVLPNSISWFWRFSSGWNHGVPITVTAKWGFAATPADVKQAVIEWVINVWRETDPAGLKLVSLEGMPLRESIPPRVEEVAKNYRMSVAKAVFV